jgi:hypothetical protein
MSSHNEDYDEGIADELAARLNAAFKPIARQMANIKFIGRPVYGPGKRKILSDPQPVDYYSNAGQVVKLPPADWQKRNRLFYHESANEIATLFPNLYKIIRRK